MVVTASRAHAAKAHADDMFGHQHGNSDIHMLGYNLFAKEIRS